MKRNFFIVSERDGVWFFFVILRVIFVNRFVSDVGLNRSIIIDI